ncbi:hypothetical protein EDB80DRAFT_737001 [Ilyonectria destructans]|nr:hypothetical protein EDB80DRAFT_737001 [Ilyonectria destructans]
MVTTHRHPTSVAMRLAGKKRVCLILPTAARALLYTNKTPDDSNSDWTPEYSSQGLVSVSSAIRVSAIRVSAIHVSAI